MEKNIATLLTTVLSTVLSVQAAVVFEGNENGTADSKTYMIADVSEVDPTVTGTAGEATGVFSGGSGSLTIVVDALANYTNASAMAATNDFGAYLAGLADVSVDSQVTHWGVDSSSVQTDGNIDRINKNEALVFTFNLSLDGNLEIQNLALQNSGTSEAMDFILYNPTSNTIENVLWSQTQAGTDPVISFASPIPDGSKLICAAQPSASVRVKYLTLDITISASSTNVPPTLFPPSVSNSLVVLDWADDPSQDVLANYKLYRSTTTNEVDFNLVASPPNNTYSDGDVTNNVTYYYKATAVSTSGVETAFGNLVSATPAIPVPTGLTAEPDDGLVSLNWNDSVDYLFDSYTVYRTTSSGSGYAGIASNLTESTFVDSNVVNDVTYYYAIAQVDVSNRVSELSAEVEAMPTTALVIEVPDSNLQADTRADDDGSGGYLSNGYKVIPNSDLKAGEYVGEIARPVLKFPLAVADLGAKTTDDIKRVVLRMFLNQNQLGEDGNENSVEVYASQSEDASSDVVASDFEDASYTWVADWDSITTNSPTGDYYDVDVTAAVLADLNNDVQDGTAGSSFRLQIKDDLTLMTTTNDLITCRFNDNSNVRPPQLRIEFFADYSFEQWAALWPAGVNVETNDYDKDGVFNLYEYALNGNPTNALDQGTLPLIRNTGSGLEYIHVKRNDDPTLVYRIETTDDLVFGSWTNTGFAVIGTNVTEDTLNVVTNTIDSTGDEKFIRLIIEN